jgi:hypothetical protein
MMLCLTSVRLGAFTGALRMHHHSCVICRHDAALLRQLTQPQCRIAGFRAVEFGVQPASLRDAGASQRKEKVMARVIQFYVPESFKPKKHRIDSERRGELLEFPLLIQREAPKTDSPMAKLRALWDDVPLLRQIPML